MGVSQCTKKQNCTGECGVITSLNYPHLYDNNHRCRWVIDVARDKYISVLFYQFDIISDDLCQLDYLEFYDGMTSRKDRLIGRYCNTKRPEKVLSNWDILLLEFSTDNSISGAGFFMEYQAHNYKISSVVQQALKSNGKRVFFFFITIY